MSKKIFKALSTLVIFSMLVMAVGTVGVIPVFAAAGPGFHTGAAGDLNPATATGVASDTPLPFYNAAVPAALGFSTGGVLNGRVCSGALTIDDSATGFNTWAGVGPNTAISYLRIHITPNAADQLAVGVFVQDAPAYTTLGCSAAAAAGTALNLVVEVPANTRVYVVVSDITGGAGFANPFAIWIQRTANAGGGLIVNSTPANQSAGAAAQVFNSTTGDKQQVIVDLFGNAWFDVPDGIYSLGYACPDATAGNVCANNAAVPGYVARYASVAAGGWLARTPLADAVTTGAQLLAATPAGVALNTLNYAFRPADAPLGFDMLLGPKNSGIVVMITPGQWSIQGSLDAAGDDYDLVSTQNYPANAATVNDFRLHIMGGISATRVTLCAPAALITAKITWQVEPFSPSTFNFFNGGLASPATCPRTKNLATTAGGYVYITSGVDYNADSTTFVDDPIQLGVEVSTVVAGVDWRYFMTPNTNPFNFAAGVLSSSFTDVFADRYITIGDTFRTTNGSSTTGAPNIVMPVSTIALTRGIWVDASANVLTRVTGPDNTATDCLTGLAITDAGLLRDDIAPCDVLTHGIDPDDPIVLANDWLTANLSPVVEIGRYLYARSLQTGGAGVVATTRNYLFAISPNDTAMLGHWAWSWVEAMYELGITDGTTAITYGPDQTITRAQMAVFLSRVLSDNSTILPAGAGVGGVFTDVPAAYWAGGEIEQLEDLGITSGIGGGLYGPDNPVTRAEMAKFVQLTFRAARTFGWTGCDLAVDGDCSDVPVWPGVGDLWDPNQNVLAAGNTFFDVPANHWANLWIEEMAFDQLTDGCTYGVYNPGVRYYCPEDSVTRGQMAKFIITALQTDLATQWNWPVLAPER